MSQASKALKEIASSQEYVSLVKAIENLDYDTIATNYEQLLKIIEDKKKNILEIMDDSPRHIEENRQQFLTAYSMRLNTTLPRLGQLTSLINKQEIAEGEIVDIGSKGDPILKTPNGKTIIVNGIKANKGDHINYKITNSGAKVDFGKAVEINADFFYNLLNQDTLRQIQNSFDYVNEYLKSNSDKNDEALGELLSNLDSARIASDKLKPEDSERIKARILANRKTILADYIISKISDFLATEEEKDMNKYFDGDVNKLTVALSATGLFRRRSLQTLRNALFIGDKLKGYDEIVKSMENNLDSMDRALNLMEFKTKIEELEPQAKTFLSKMEELSIRFNKKSHLTANTLAENNTIDINEIQKQLENAFSGNSLYVDFRKVFHSPNEFFSLRDATIKLEAAMGNNNCLQAESIIRPYLKQKVASIFEINQRQNA